MKKIILSSVVCATLSFTGCGSSSGTSTSLDDNSTSATTSGTVSGSYYEGATVCFDTDGDGSCTGETSSTTSDSHGEFTLTGSTDYPIIAEIPSGAKKHEVIGDVGIDINDTTKTVFAIPANAIARAKIDGGRVILSVISTRLYTYVKDHPNDAIGAAMEAVAGILGINKDDLLKDFNSASVDTSIKTILREKANALLEKIEGKATIAEVKTAADDFVAAMTIPGTIDVVKAK